MNDNQPEKLRKHTNVYLIISVVMNVIIFSFCSTTSPLYAFCDESHVFFNVGKAILKGKVLYRDILEQKGILIYLIQIPAYLISHTNFTGVWLIEIFLLSLCVYYLYKIAYQISKSDICALFSTVGVESKSRSEK